MCREGGRQRGETNDRLGSRGYSLLDDAPKGLTDTGVKYRLVAETVCRFETVVVTASPCLCPFTTLSCLS